MIFHRDGAAPLDLNREQATTAIKDILNKFPRMGVEVMAGNGEMYVVHANETTHAHQVDEHLGSIACPIDCVPDGWVKVVFAADPEAIRKLGQYAKPSTTAGITTSWPPTTFT